MRFFHAVHRLILSTCILVISTIGYACADDSKPASPPIERLQDRSAAPKSTTELLEELKRERNPDVAKTIAANLVTQWADTGSATADLLTQWADKARREKRNAAALDFLDQVIVLDPKDPRGWAKRATLNYSLGNVRKAVSDLNEVLKIEPRYFPAIQMLATILTESGSDEKAMKAWQDYLDVYPADRSAQKAFSDLAEKLAGART
ncbi:tetratricopeptide repeat protein [Rhizobium oryziradicis]|uniref:tetratricopeptide repeat protein n=1 Tax=Rhizobium oryziradicis TaxID=1867956 RepID=UPI00094F6F4E|nr:tetratricopeptide repeat protein [Rhizobium oryziradicis]